MALRISAAQVLRSRAVKTASRTTSDHCRHAAARLLLRMRRVTRLMMTALDLCWRSESARAWVWAFQVRQAAVSLPCWKALKERRNTSPVWPFSSSATCARYVAVAHWRKPRERLRCWRRAIVFRTSWALASVASSLCRWARTASHHERHADATCRLATRVHALKTMLTLCSCEARCMASTLQLEMDVTHLRHALATW